MKISGFTMVRNAEKLYYPLVESICSILDLVDEYIVVIGNNDPDDHTLEMVESIGSEKIKIYRSVWDFKAYPHGSELAHQTDIAKEYFSGDWLFYLQADEVVHEKDHAVIRQRCEQLIDNQEVEALVFRYIHFWGDYNHAFTANHNWYRREMRIIRNRPEIHSWRDAQSFRLIPDFTKEKYLTKVGTRKLNVAKVEADIYHYGWVRPPLLMNKKTVSFENCYKDDNQPVQQEIILSEVDFGALGCVPKFKGSHPQVMKAKIHLFDWGNKLNYTKTLGRKPKYKHERWKYRIITFIENLFFKNGLFTFKNYEVVK